MLRVVIYAPEVLYLNPLFQYLFAVIHAPEKKIKSGPKLIVEEVS